MSGGFSLLDLPRKYQEQAARQMHKTAVPAMVEALPKERRLRQDQKPVLNKLETKFLDYMQAKNPGLRIHSQAKKYQIARGIWYKPDFVATVDDIETAWEVKGPHVFRGGFENLKTAACQYPEVLFILVWLDEEKNWKFQNILA